MAQLLRLTIRSTFLGLFAAAWGLNVSAEEFIYRICEGPVAEFVEGNVGLNGEVSSLEGLRRFGLLRAETTWTIPNLHIDGATDDVHVVTFEDLTVGVVVTQGARVPVGSVELHGPAHSPSQGIMIGQSSTSTIEAALGPPDEIRPGNDSNEVEWTYVCSNEVGNSLATLSIRGDRVEAIRWGYFID